MTAFVYRLQLLLEQKEEAKKQAERELARQEEELHAELQALEERKQQEKQLVAKREQLRRDLLVKPELDQALSARQVQERCGYIKVVGIQIEEANADVLAQLTVVKACEANVQQAKERAKEARREVEVLTKHRAKQEERFLRDELAKEDLALDEIGNVLYATRRRPT
jgi:flagellar biosynthesis chaperone FliJ